MKETIINCERCGARCKVAGQRDSDAKMLRHSKEPKGLCVNCAVHDWLRNTYPPNILLAQSGPKILLYSHIQDQFAEIMQVGFADAKPDEINWQMIVDNWELPFAHKMKPSAMNPVSQKELGEIASGERPGLGSPVSKSIFENASDVTITSFEQLNELEPGLGNELKKCLKKTDDE